MIKNTTKNTTLAQDTVVAGTPLKRMKGLLGRQGLNASEALIIPHCQSVHMFFMKFAIDVIFIDKSNHVVGLCPHLSPNTLSPIFWKSTCAIELPTGTIKQSNTQIGDLISILRK